MAWLARHFGLELRLPRPALALAVLLALASTAIAQDRRTDGVIRFYQAKVKEDPLSFSNFNRLAAAYLQKARETGDLTYYQLAGKAVEESLKLESSHAEAASGLGLRAAVLFSQHGFAEGAAEAEKAIRLDPSDLANYAAAGDAWLELGEYDKARQLYSHLQSDRPGSGVEYLRLTREASLALAQGQPQLAVEPLRRAIAAAEKLRVPAENLAWTQSTLAETYLQAGRLPEAEAAVAASLASFPRFHRALGVLGQLRAAQKNDAAAIAAYRQALEVIPLPVYAAALGDLYARNGKAAEAEQQYKLVEFIANLSALSKGVYSRDLSLFYSDHKRNLPEALRLASGEHQLRHDLYTQDALAWALYRSGDLKAALEASRLVATFHPQEPLLLYRMAAIRADAGDPVAALALFESALRINPEFHVIYAGDARQRMAALAQTPPSPREGR
jgi:tetratricopeptide (TPR) repeat protein